MNLVAEYAQEMTVMHRGVMKLKGTPHQVFKEVNILNECGITLPIAAQNYYELAKRCNLSLSDLPLTTDEFVSQIESLIGRE